MLRFLIRRLVVAIPTVLMVITVAFFMMRAAPGSPFEGDRKLPPEIRANVERKFGFNRPLVVQYADYLGGVLHGDFGPSLKYQDKTVLQITSDITKQVFPLTLALDDPRMTQGLERLRRIAARVDAAKAKGGVVGTIKRAAYTLAATATFARLYLLPVHENVLPEQIRMAPAW